MTYCVSSGVSVGPEGPLVHAGATRPGRHGHSTPSLTVIDRHSSGICTAVLLSLLPVSVGLTGRPGLGAIVGSGLTTGGKRLKVRNTPSWPRSWANFSLLWLHSHRNAWANWHLLGQPNTFLAQAAAAPRAGRALRVLRRRLHRALLRGQPPGLRVAGGGAVAVPQRSGPARGG
jgi:hypothetical protein